MRVAGRPFDPTLMGTSFENLAHRGYTFEGFLRRHNHSEYQNYDYGYPSPTPSSSSARSQVATVTWSRSKRNKFVLAQPELMTPRATLSFNLSRCRTARRAYRHRAGQRPRGLRPVPMRSMDNYGILLRNLGERARIPVNFTPAAGCIPITDAHQL